jgi:two-component system, LytTR family, response regulator
MLLETILIDREHKARANLRRTLEEYCKQDIHIIGECENSEDAFVMINKAKPDLILLDIELGNGTGFDLLNRFKKYHFKIIFVTDFDRYLIRAIKFCALDYLLKPISKNELILAVERAKHPATNASDEKINKLLEIFRFPRKKPDRIAIPVQTGFEFIPVEQIVFCRAEKQYTYIYEVGGNVICSSLNLGEYDEMLQEYDFFRVHHSYIISRRHIRRYIRGEAGEIVMENNMNIPVSRRKKHDLLDWLMK